MILGAMLVVPVLAYPLYILGYRRHPSAILGLIFVIFYLPMRFVPLISAWQHWRLSFQGWTKQG